MNDQKYYLQYKGEPWTGTSHQLYNLSVLLAEASILGRIAVLPDLTLAAHHNHGKAIRVPLSNYFDLSVFAAYVALITLPEFEQLNFSHPVWVDEKVPTRSLQGNPASLIVREFTNPSDVFSAPMKSDAQVEAVAAQMRSLVAPNQVVRSYAETVLSILGQDFDTIHVRRGDLLQQAQQEWWRFPGFDRRTRPQGIRTRIAAWSPAGRTLYIMTDELETGFFEPLKAWYEVYTFRDFPLFETLRTKDNYLLYEVEKYIASRARLQIEMFSKYGQNVNFAYCLLDYPRWGVNNRFSRSLEKCYRVLWAIKSWLKHYLRYLRQLVRIS